MKNRIYVVTDRIANLSHDLRSINWDGYAKTKGEFIMLPNTIVKMIADVRFIQGIGNCKLVTRFYGDGQRTAEMRNWINAWSEPRTNIERQSFDELISELHRIEKITRNKTSEFSVTKYVDQVPGGIKEFTKLAKKAFTRAGCDLSTMSKVEKFTKPDDNLREIFFVTAHKIK